MFPSDQVTLRKAGALLMMPEIHLTLSYRISNALYASGHRTPAFVLHNVSKFLFGCDISPAATIGAGLRLVHCSDIVIGPDVQVGEDVWIFNGVTLGNRLGSARWGMPTVRDRVLLGTGAKVLGDIEIGDDAKIGANAVVLASVPAGQIAVGVPARIQNNPPPEKESTKEKAAARWAPSVQFLAQPLRSSRPRPAIDRCLNCATSSARFGQGVCLEAVRRFSSAALS